MTSKQATSADEAPLYEPQNPEQSRVFHFLRCVNAKYHLNLKTYADLYQWSTTHLDDFWGLVWDETGVIGHKGGHVVDISQTPAENPSWFSEAQVNFAENMLHCRSAEKVALIQASTHTTSFISATLGNASYVSSRAHSGDA